LTLSELQRSDLLGLLKDIGGADVPVGVLSARREVLDNKQGSCSHCGHRKYGVSTFDGTNL